MLESIANGILPLNNCTLRGPPNISDNEIVAATYDCVELILLPLLGLKP